MRRSLVIVPAALLALAACAAAASCGGDSGGTDTTPPKDTGIDSGLPDTGAPDTNPPDTGTVDTGTSDDADSGPPPWPTCDARPDAATATTIQNVWTASASKPVFSWVSGVVVTAVSQGSCADGKACNLFLEDPGTYATLGDAAHHAIKVFVSATAASRFSTIRVGDKVDVAAWGWRYDIGGQNEILLQVADTPLRGCMKKTGTGTIDPVPATLTDLGSIAAYETTYGPVLVKVGNVSGKPGTVTSETFGLWVTGATDSGASVVVSLSPYFLAGGVFTGFTAGMRTDFASIVGVFGLFSPGPGDGGAPPKYLEIYPRAPSDWVVK